MGDFTWLVITGLGFDVAGAILILFPLLHLVKINNPKGDPSPNEKRFVGGIVDLKHGYDQDVKAQTGARIGLGFLVFGFILQIIGNWLQSLPS